MTVQYSGSYKVNNQKIDLKVNFDIQINRVINHDYITNKESKKDTVKVINFSYIANNGEEVEISPLDQGDKSINDLATMLNKDINDDSVTRKANLWGPRESVERCYLTKDAYFNTGSSRVKLDDGTTLHESGLCTAQGGSVEKTTALVISVNCLMHYAYMKAPDFFTSNIGTYTVSPNSEDTVKILESAGYKKLDAGDDLLKQITDASNQRFKIEDGIFLEKSGEEYVEKFYFTHNFDQEVEGMGEVEPNDVE
jgi:hypothetical protein